MTSGPGSPLARTLAPGIRRAGPADLARIEELEAVCFDEPWRGRELAVWLEPERGAAWLAEGAVRADGFALFQLLPGAAELLRVAVRPEARRRGVARRLLDGALRSLAAGGRASCFLEVRSANRPAVALYEALGFREIGLRRGYYTDGADALVLARGVPAERTGGG